MDLLRESYGETDVMDIGKTCHWEVNLLQTGYGEVANLLTYYRLATDLSIMLRTCYGRVSDE